MSERPYNHYRRTVGKYNWADPKEDQACYQFILREDAPIKRFSVCVPLDREDVPSDGSVLQIAGALLRIKESYLFSNDCHRLRALIAYLTPLELEDQRDDLAYRIAVAQQRIADATKRLDEMVSLRERVIGYIAEDAA